jgi:hypothetical protein
MEKPRDRKILIKAHQELGAQSLFRLLFLAYLHANFLKTQWSPETTAKVIRFSEIKNTKAANIIQGVIRIGLNLDPAFTQFTGSFCFRLMGIKGSIYEFLNFDFLKMIEKESQYQIWMDQMCSVIFEDESRIK